MRNISRYHQNDFRENFKIKLVKVSLGKPEKIPKKKHAIIVIRLFYVIAGVVLKIIREEMLGKTPKLFSSEKFEVLENH